MGSFLLAALVHIPVTVIAPEKPKVTSNAIKNIVELKDNTLNFKKITSRKYIP
jgi:hypothetical protein